VEKCGELVRDVFTLRRRKSGQEKYDETAASMIACCASGSGFPWYRWKACRRIWASVASGDTVRDRQGNRRSDPAGGDELIRQAARRRDAQRRYFHARAVPGSGRGEHVDIAAERTGVFTTGIISIGEGYRIGLYSLGASMPERTWPTC